MEELIFFAVIIAFSIIDSIARSRKKKRQQQTGTATLPEAPAEWDREPDYPTYDAEPSYDDEEEEEEQEPAAASSETMIPVDIWEEIAGIAKGRRREAEVPAPAPTWAPEPALPPPAPVHRIHLSHAGFGTDPSERAPSAEDGLDPLRRTLGADAAAIRRQLRSQGAHALRQAVILHEVLGRPAATRGDRFED